MKIFTIPVSYELAGTINLKLPDGTTPDEALQYAKEKIDELPLPTNGNYVDGSYQVNAESGEELMLYNL